MKKYKFKLEAVLKVRKIKEDQCKMQLGRLQVHLESLKNQIKKHNQDIDEAYVLQEKSLEQGSVGLESRFHPYFIQGKQSHISQIEDEIEEYENRIEHMLYLLKQLRADVKVIEEMKEKDKTKYKKELNKKINANIEEQVQNWNLSKIL